MRTWKASLLKWLVVILIVLGMLAAVGGFRRYEYRNAMDYADNYQYLVAARLFREMTWLSSAEEKAREMEQQTQQIKEVTLKLLPIPNFDPEHRAVYRYWDPEACIGLGVNWDLSLQGDEYVTWGYALNRYADAEKREYVFGPDQTESKVDIFSIRIIRYDFETGEYLFLENRSVGKFEDPSGFLDWTLRFRGRLLENGHLEIYNDQGERYEFWPHSYHDLTINKERIVDEDLIKGY